MESNKDRRDTSQTRSYSSNFERWEGKEATELSNSFETTNWYFTILGQVDSLY